MWKRTAVFSFPAPTTRKWKRPRRRSRVSRANSKLARSSRALRKDLEFGAIVDLGGGKDGMIHVSELKDGFVKNVEDVVKMGDFVRAKIISVDEGGGKIRLSIKQLAK